MEGVQLGRKTDKEVRDYVESRGYKWISGEYRNASSRIRLECPKGHLWETTWGSFHCGESGCSICAGILRKTPEEVQEYVESRGYKWVNGEYQNASSRLELECPKGHLWETTWGSFCNARSECSICAKGIDSVCAGRLRKTPEEVRDYIDSRGYKWVSGEYQNACSRLKLECPKGHLWKTTWGSFHCGESGCSICAYINSLGPNHPNWRGGISKDPYCEIWNIKEFKEMIKARDGYT